MIAAGSGRGKAWAVATSLMSMRGATLRRHGPRNFHGNLGPKTVQVTANRDHRQGLARELHRHRGVPGSQVSVDGQLVPALGMTDV
jgi:hypothetical protein